MHTEKIQMKKQNKKITNSENNQETKDNTKKSSGVFSYLLNSITDLFTKDSPQINSKKEEENDIQLKLDITQNLIVFKHYKAN